MAIHVLACVIDVCIVDSFNVYIIDGKLALLFEARSYIAGYRDYRYVIYINPMCRI